MTDGTSATIQDSTDSARSEGSAAETAFDYGRSAELFPTRSRRPRGTPMTYKRFDTAADAIRFAIEELPSDRLLGAYLQVDEDRFGSAGIRRLYNSARYPLKRRTPSRQ